MSGGHFDYQDNRIGDIITSIEKVINNNGKLKPNDELYWNKDYYKEQPEELYYVKYPDDIIEKFKIGVAKLKEAYIYAHRIDWFLSGDDGEESFLERLKEELNEKN